MIILTISRVTRIPIVLVCRTYKRKISPKYESSVGLYIICIYIYKTRYLWLYTSAQGYSFVNISMTDTSS